MRRPRSWIVAVVVAAGWPNATLRADDDRPAVPGQPVRPRAIEPAGIDLAAHVDINVVLPTDQWRVAGGLHNVVIAGGGRLVLDGDLTIGGEPVADSAERIRTADVAALARLRQAQRDRLAAVAATGALTAAQRRALELATELDIRRVMTEVARLRERYAGRRANLGDDAWRRFQKDVQSCRRAIADPFGDDSLFAAVQAGAAARR